MIDEAAVNTLLAASRSAHDMKKRKAGVIDKHGTVIASPNWPEAEKCIVDALRLRLEAHDLDPKHKASGWADDRSPDAELIRFYIAYSKPFIPEKQLKQVYKRFPDYEQIEYIP